MAGYLLGRQLDANTSRWLPLGWGYLLWCSCGFLRGLGLESTPTSVWTGLLLTIHGGYQYRTLSNRCLPRTPEQPASYALVIYLIH